MLRGQVSLEMGLVIIVAVTAVSVLDFLAQNTVDSQRNVMVQSQAIVLAQTVAVDLTGLLQLQETVSGTEITFPTKKIQVLNPTFKEKCVITITLNGPPYGDPLVSVKFDWENDGEYDITISKSTRIPNAFNIQNLNGEIPCGEPVVATRV